MSDKEKIIIPLTGRIDSNSAHDTELMIEEKLKQNADKLPVFDADDLEYISSAGLRVLMKFRKAAGSNVEVINVSPDVYDIFDVTGFTELLDVKKKLREISVDGCEVIGKGFYGTVYRIDDETIVKAYNSPDSIPMIENEKKMAKLAFLKGIPTAISYDIVRIGDSYGSVFEMLKASTLNDLLIQNPDDADNIVRKYVDFIKLVHDVEMDEGTLPQTRDIFIGYLDTIGEYLAEGQKEQIKKLLEAMPDDLHVVHGDFQMKNVMMVDGEPMLIDMDTLSCGHPVFDLAGLCTTYQLFEEDDVNNSMDFLGISNDMSNFVWEKLMHYYVGTDDAARLASIADKVRLAACVRFLFIIAVSALKDSELGKIRIKHAVEHITDLLGCVDSLIF